MNRYYKPYKLSLLQRICLTPYFGINAILKPSNGEYVAGLGDVTGTYSLRHLKQKLVSTDEGRELLRDKPLINADSVSFSSLKDMATGTMGNDYFKYMDSHGFSANERPVVRFMMDEDLAYIMTRYRQVHDFWHVLSGLPPTLLGEVALKCFEHQITGLPSCALGGMLGQVTLSPIEVKELYATYIPWSIRAARQCNRDLLAYRYERHLGRPVSEIRREINFEPAPPLLN